MYQNITKGIHELLKEANEVARLLVLRKQNYYSMTNIIYLRGESEILRDGTIPGAFSCLEECLNFE